MLVPGARRYLLEGNHEDRLRRALWNMNGAAEAFHSLRVFAKMMTWPVLLDLERIGWKWLSTQEQTRTKILPKFIVKHGTVIRKHAAYTARGEWEKYGKSGASGHTHRLGMFMHRDHNGNHVWVETGCLCTLEPHYMPDPDWQQGFLIMTFENTTGAFQAEPVYIHHGLAVWRGKVYRA